MSPIGKAVALCLLVTCMALAGMPGVASASRKQVTSGATLKSVSADGVAGTISSGQGPCRAMRTVNVYMVNSSSPATAVPFGTAITSGDGSWSIRDWAYPGEYFAVVAARKTRHFVCGTATSNSVAWWTSGAAS